MGWWVCSPRGRRWPRPARSVPLLTVPASDEVKRYWTRIGFFAHAADLFEVHGKVPKAEAHRSSDVLLDVTPIRASEDIHEIVGKIQENAAARS